MLRFNARLAVQGGGSQRVRDSFDRSIATFRQLGYPFCLAVVLLEYGEWIAGEGMDPEPFLAEAHDMFERLRARPWLDRLAQIRA